MAESWEYQAGKDLKEILNPPRWEPCIGIVTSVEPFGASIKDGKFILNKSNTKICQTAIQKAYEFENASGTLDGEGFDARGVVTLKDVMVVGQEILIIPIYNGQQFIVVDVLAGGWI